MPIVVVGHICGLASLPTVGVIHANGLGAGGRGAASTRPLVPPIRDLFGCTHVAHGNQGGRSAQWDCNGDCVGPHACRGAMYVASISLRKLGAVSMVTWLAQVPLDMSLDVLQHCHLDSVFLWALPCTSTYMMPGVAARVTNHSSI